MPIHTLILVTTMVVGLRDGYRTITMLLLHGCFWCFNKNCSTNRHETNINHGPCCRRQWGCEANAGSKWDLFAPVTLFENIRGRRGSSIPIKHIYESKYPTSLWKCMLQMS
jgi:hypothetical protein